MAEICNEEGRPRPFFGPCSDLTCPKDIYNPSLKSQQFHIYMTFNAKNNWPMECLRIARYVVYEDMQCSVS